MPTPPKLSFQCPVKWESMAGDESKRFCDNCQKHVHNISLMTADERARLLAKKTDGAEHLCVTYLKRPDGEMVTPENTPPSKILRFGIAAGLSASALTLAACSGPTNPPSDTTSPQTWERTGGTPAPASERLTGDIAPAHPAPTQVTTPSAQKTTDAGKHHEIHSEYTTGAIIMPNTGK